MQLEEKKQETADCFLQVRITAYLEYFPWRERAIISACDKRHRLAISVYPACYPPYYWNNMLTYRLIVAISSAGKILMQRYRQKIGGCQQEWG